MHVTEQRSRARQDQVQCSCRVREPEERTLIGRTAQLEFQMCDDESDFLTKLTDLPEWAKLQTSGFQRRDGRTAQDNYLEFPDDKLKEMRSYFVGKVPSGLVIKYGHENRRDGKAMWRTYTLKADVALTGDDLVNAQVSMGSPEQPQPYVGIEFSPTGRSLW